MKLYNIHLLHLIPVLLLSVACSAPEKSEGEFKPMSASPTQSSASRAAAPAPRSAGEEKDSSKDQETDDLYKHLAEQRADRKEAEQNRLAARAKSEEAQRQIEALMMAASLNLTNKVVGIASEDDSNIWELPKELQTEAKPAAAPAEDSPSEASTEASSSADSVVVEGSSSESGSAILSDSDEDCLEAGAELSPETMIDVFNLLAASGYYPRSGADRAIAVIVQNQKEKEAESLTTIVSE
jgi:hypothetical protein